MRLHDRLAQRRRDLETANRWRHDLPAAPLPLDLRLNDPLALATQPLSATELRALSGAMPGAGASRLVAGTTAEQAALERSLAGWVGQPAALVLGSAYSANVALLSGLPVAGDRILSDALNHASLIDGCRLSRADVRVYPHLDLDALDGLLRQPCSGVTWIVTESYFSMDADSPDFSRLAKLCEKYEAALVVDEAHALGVLGQGRGLALEAGVTAAAITGGFGKALGLHGGFVAASDELMRLFWNVARPFVFSTGLSPLWCQLLSLRLRQVMDADEARARLAAQSLRLREHLLAGGLRLTSRQHGPLFPIVLGSEAAALGAAEALAARGIGVGAIRPPTVPAGTSRLRLTLRADLSDTLVDGLAESLLDAVAGGKRAPRAALGPSGETRPGTLTPKPEEGTGLPERWFVVGTGTGIGKSFVAEGLVRLLAQRGIPVGGLKPVETGVAPGAAAEDAERLARASFGVTLPGPHPYASFRAPLTPARAARDEGRRIELEEVRAWERAAEVANPKAHWVIETAGGALSPLSDLEDNLSLVQALGPGRVVLVAPDRLGVLHDVLASVDAMRRRALTPAVVLLSAPPAADPSTGTNADELRRHPRVPTVLTLERATPGAELVALGPLADWLDSALGARPIAAAAATPQPSLR